MPALTKTTSRYYFFLEITKNYSVTEQTSGIPVLFCDETELRDMWILKNTTYKLRLSLNS
jgi:hypothetical protein